MAAILGWTTIRWQSYELRSLLVRSSRQTIAWIWHDVWVGILVAVFVVVLFAYLAGDQWKLAVTINVTVYLAVFVALWLVSLIRTTFWRSVNGTWRTAVHQHKDQPDIATIVLFGKGRTTHIVQGIRCVISDPNRVRSIRTRALSSQVWDLPWIYPAEFEGGVKLVEGRYRVLWQERIDDRWRELLMKELTMKVPVTQTTPPWHDGP